MIDSEKYVAGAKEVGNSGDVDEDVSVYAENRSEGSS